MIHQPLNILQSCFSLSWGGLELQALEQSMKLRRRGHRVSLACPAGSRLEEEAQKQAISTVPLKVKGYFNPVAVWKLRGFLLERSVDIIHSHHSRDLATLVPALKLARERIPLILTKWMGSYIIKKDLLHRFTYAHVSRVIAISEVIHRNVLETTPMTPDRVLTMPGTIDTEQFSPSRVSPTRVRHEFGYDDDTILIGFVGRFSPGKGHEELLEAAQVLCRRYGNIRFLVVGEASFGEQAYEHRIKSLCHTMKLDRKVTFAGFRKDVPDLMAAFDIFAFPSHAEAFGLVLIEAMAMERPVVSTNCDGVLDIVVDGETGISVPPRNGRALADALERLGNEPELRNKMGKAGRRRAEELFDQKKQLQRLEELYYELAGLPMTTPRPQEELTSLLPTGH